MSKRIKINIIPDQSVNVNQVTSNQEINITPDQNIIVNPITLNQGVVNHSVTHQLSGSDELLHNLLGGLQGGSEDGYYHLSSGQYNDLVFISGNQVIDGKKTFIDHLTLQNINNQLQIKTNSTGNTLFITAPTINANRTYTIPDVGSSAAFVLTSGPQTINGSKNFTTRPTVNTTGLLLNSETGDFITKNQTGLFYPNSNPSGYLNEINNVVFLTGNQIINGSKTFTDKVTLINQNNQLQIKTNSTGNTLFITVPSINSNHTYTIPDVGSSAAFVLTSGPQTINGIKTFGSRPIVNGTGVLLSGEVLTDFDLINYLQKTGLSLQEIDGDIEINGELNSTVGVYAPNLTNIVYSVNDQTIAGVKTFANNIIGNGTDNLFVNESGFSPYSLLTQQQLMLGGHKFRQLVNVNSKITGTNINTTAGAFQVLGMKAAIGPANSNSAACYTFDGLYSTDISTAVIPINNEIDVFFHGVAMQFNATSNWVARINFGVPFSATVPLADAPATSSNRQWGVEFYYSGGVFRGRLYYYFDSINYGDSFVLPIYSGALPAAWAGFIYSIRMRQTPIGNNSLRLEFYINNSISNNGGTALSKNVPIASLETLPISNLNYKFDGKYINFEVASSSVAAPSNIVRMQCNSMYCQFK